MVYADSGGLLKLKYHRMTKPWTQTRREQNLWMGKLCAFSGQLLISPQRFVPVNQAQSRMAYASLSIGDLESQMPFDREIY